MLTTTANLNINGFNLTWFDLKESATDKHKFPYETGFNLQYQIRTVSAKNDVG